MLCIIIVALLDQCLIIAIIYWDTRIFVILFASYSPIAPYVLLI